jgi:uncharacterized linocin/CFP29 family protein
MSNLHRELAPITAAAWVEIENEARRTFDRHVAGRRVVDVVGPAGTTLAAVDTGHVTDIAAPQEGVRARLRDARPLVELRVPFTVSREAVDAVERGSRDSDWQPVKDAAQWIATAEDRAIFEGFEAAGITGVRVASSNPVVPLPGDVTAYPTAVAQAVSHLRLAGVDGPYTLLLSADLFTLVSESTDGGYPILEHLDRVLDGDVVWAPSISGALLLSARGGDFELHLGQDLSIGYLAHDATSVELYFQESFTFIVQTDEASVGIDG